MELWTNPERVFNQNKITDKQQKKVATLYKSYLIYNRLLALNNDLIIEHWDILSRTEIELSKLEDLQKALDLIKKVYPGWKNDLCELYVIDSSIHASWIDYKYPLVRINLIKNVKDFPLAKVAPNKRLVEKKPQEVPGLKYELQDITF